MSPPGALSEEEINELIWGKLESEFMDREIPLRAASDLIDWTRDLIVQMFYGFMYFMHYKCGLTPTFAHHEEKDFRDSNLDDPSMWAESLMCVGREHGEPFSVRHFAGQNDDSHTIVVLIDTLALFECGMMLNETRLRGESRFSDFKMAEEFHAESNNLPRMLAYFKHIYDTDRKHAHVLVLRPTKMMKYLGALNRGMMPEGGYPDKVIRVEEWEKMSWGEKAAPHMSPHVQICNEANFRELLRERSIDIPNVQFLTFYEYMWDKIPSWAVSEWRDIRDRYTDLIKNMFMEDYLDTDRTGLDKAKEALAEADRLLGDGCFTESLRKSYIGMEWFLNASVRKIIPITRKIEAVTHSQGLRIHREALIFIKKTRDALEHADGISECNEDTARRALDMMNGFLFDVEKSPQDARDAHPFGGGSNSGGDGGAGDSVPSYDAVKTSPKQSAGRDAGWEGLVAGTIRELSTNNGAPWVMLADVGNRLRANNPAFDPRNEDFENLHSMIESKPDMFTLEDNVVNGVSSGHRVRLNAEQPACSASGQA